MKIFIIIIIVVVIAAAAFFFWQRTKMAGDADYAKKVTRRRAERAANYQRKKVERAEQKMKKAKYLETIAPEKADFVRAKQEYNARVDAAEGALKRAIREHDRAIRDQERTLAEIEKRYSSQITSLGGLKLYSDHIATRGCNMMLNGTFKAQIVAGADLVAAAPNMPEFFMSVATGEGDKPTSGGSVVGGVGTPEEPWQLIVDPTYDYMVVRGTVVEQGSQMAFLCMPLDERRREAGFVLADQINAAAAASEANEQARRQELAAAEEALDALRANTSAIDEAEETLERERDNCQDVEDARQRLAEAEERAQTALDYHP